MREKNLLPSAGGGFLSLALVYPNSYPVAMSNLGFLSMFRTISGIFGVHPERATLPEPEDERSLIRTGAPLLTIESLKPLREFDALLFSISFELDYYNVLKILKLSNIPIRSNERERRFPTIIAGGAAVMINPEVISPFIDAFALGEGEVIAEPVVLKLIKMKEEGAEKEEMLAELSHIPGVYIPGHFSVEYDDQGKVKEYKNRKAASDSIKIQRLPDLKGQDMSSPIVTPDAEFSNMLLLEMGRGCPFSCAFCVVKGLYDPVRMRDIDDITSDIRRSVDITDRVGLISPAAQNHPNFFGVLQELEKNGCRLGLPSLRAEGLTNDEIGCLANLGIKTMTIAPESGSVKMRMAMGKSITDDEIFDLIGRSNDAGIRNFRLYFMIGLPGETTPDIDAIINLIKSIRHTLKSRGTPHHAPAERDTGGGKITVSINPFVPKPHTPLMWCPMEETKVLAEKIKKIRLALKKMGKGGISVISEPPKWSYIQALISRGDRRVSGILESALIGGGDWKGAMRKSAINPDFYVLRERDGDETFPWDFIDYGRPKDTLHKRYLKILSK